MKTYDVFIQFNSQDGGYAEKLAEILKDGGVNVWFEPWERIPGKFGLDSFSNISKAVEHCKHILILIGEHGLGEPRAIYRTEIESPVQRIYRLAYSIIPVLIPGGEPTKLPLFLRTIVYCDLRKWEEKTLNDLIVLLKSKPKVFLCHAIEDKKQVDILHDYFEKNEIETWYDKNDLKIGQMWKEEIFEAIEKTDFFAVCLSSRAITKKGFIQNEIRTAIAEYRNRPFRSPFLLPLKLDNCQIPKIRLDSTTLLSDLQWLNVFDKNWNVVPDLSTQIKEIWNNRKT